MVSELHPVVLIGIAAVLLIGKIGGEIFERIRQPAVLGELVAGILVGGLSVIGLTVFEPIKTDPVIAALAQIGVIILLFEVGLETNVKEMMEVGWSSLFVACAGVITPFSLGWIVARYFLPNESSLAHVFVGATLCATSVGITARVLRDLGRIKSKEARIILGAAVIDDVMGLVILAVVSGAIHAAATGTQVSAASISLIAGKAFVFLVGALLIGHFVVPHFFKGAARFKTAGMLLSLSLVFCFAFAWFASFVGLAPIVGAFAAGLVLDEVHFKPFAQTDNSDLVDLLKPLSTILVPIFFVLMGMQVDLRSFARTEIIGFALVLTFVAIVSKQICSLAVTERRVNRLAIGLGMIPRGEVGLIFAGIGSALMLPDAAGTLSPVIRPATFAAVVVMVAMTTLVTPPALKWALARRQSSEGQSKRKK